MLRDFATGALDPAAALVVRTHAEMCFRCAGEIALAEVVAGAMLAEIEPEELSPDMFHRIMARIDAEDARLLTLPRALPSTVPAPPPAWAAHLPDTLRAVVARSPRRRWRLILPGVRSLELDVPGSVTGARMLRIAPGAGIPHHGHGGEELTLVLGGAFWDEQASYVRGDLAVSTATTTHRPTAFGDTPCLCLAVTAAPLRFTGPLGMIQRAFSRRG